MPITDPDSVSKKLRRRIMTKRYKSVDIIDESMDKLAYYKSKCKRLQKIVDGLPTLAELEEMVFEMDKMATCNMRPCQQCSNGVVKAIYKRIKK